MSHSFDYLSNFLSGNLNMDNLIEKARKELEKIALLFHDSIKGGEEREQFISIMDEAKQAGIFDLTYPKRPTNLTETQRNSIKEIYNDTEKYAHGYAALINEQGFWLRKYEIVNNEVISIQSSKVDLRYREALHLFGRLQEVVGFRAMQFRQGGKKNE